MALLLFDIDGTLINRSPGFEDAREDRQEAIFETYHIRVSFDETVYDGSTDRLIMIDALQKNKVPYDDASLESCLRVYGELMPEKPEGFIVIPGVLEALPLLPGKHLLGLLTGNVEQRARKKLNPFQINNRSMNSYFSFGGFGGTDFHNSRAELIPIAIQRAREYGWDGDNKKTFVIDDSQKGLAAAIDAGVNPLGITTGRYTYDQLRETGTENIVNNMTQVPNLLERLSQSSL